MLEKLLEIGRQVLAEQDIDRVLATAMDGAIEISGAERGMILLFDQHGKISFQTARNLKKEDLDQPKYEISRTIIKKVRTERIPLYLKNARDDPAFRASQSVHKLKILSVICLPLLHDDEVFGAVYLDNRTVLGAFTPESFDFAQKFADFISAAARHALERTKLHSRVEALEKELRNKWQFQTIVGEHPAIVEIMNLVAQIADTTATVLISGESGTGKELIARALHTNSRRKDQPFVPINCSALPESLLESELFGHVRGAFTGATENKTGWFERANAGTIFFDEISEMSTALQAKLLRVLQNGEFSPVGNTIVRRCDVRIVAATNRNLEQLVAQRLFREDLYYRLNVIGIELPPLRERQTDTPLLAQHFISHFSAKYNKKNLQLSRQALAQLLAYDFPGNVRELENLVERAVILAKGSQIEIEHLPATLHPKERRVGGENQAMTFKAAKQKMLKTFEREFIVQSLLQTEGNISQAAKLAGMDMKNFYMKMKKHGIDARVFNRKKAGERIENTRG